MVIVARRRRRAIGVALGLRDTAGMDDLIGQIREAFVDDLRPPNSALLHPACHDDMDLEELYKVGHWTEVPEDMVVNEYAALSFLSPEGFRHFIPAYLLWVLRHPGAPEAVVDSTIWAFLPELHGGELAPFVRSKWAALGSEQRSAITAFLTAMREHHDDAAAALASWLGSTDD